MARVMQSILYRNHHLLIGNSSDFCLLVKILIEDKVFKLKSGHKTKKTKFVDLFVYELRIIAAEGLLKKYQH